MKRSKITRYYAGKRPAYAKEEDEEEWVTDEEEEDEDRVATSSDRKLEHLGVDSDDDEESSSDSDNCQPPPPPSRVEVATEDHDEEDEDDDDPRFRRLKQIEAKSNPADLIHIQRTQRITSKYDLTHANLVIDQDEDEEEVRQRHRLARKRKQEPVGPQAIFGASAADQQLDVVNEEESTRRLDTDDILQDLKITRNNGPVRDQEAESRLIEKMLEQSKLEASLTSQTLEKVEKDIRREREQEVFAKSDIGAREMSLVITDDEDEELAYEEWKLREIKRVKRDRSERMLLAAATAR